MITVIGLDGSPLASEAANAIAAASLVIGGRRQLAAVSLKAGARTITLGSLAPALDALGAHRAGDAVVLASGDPGFFGILRSLRERGLACTVLPAVSSVSLAFARAMIPWDDAQVVSVHGRDPRHAVNVCRAHPKVAVLTGPGCGPAELGSALGGWPRRLVVAERLGAPGERITRCSAAEAVTREWEDPNVVLVLADMPAGGPALSWPPATAPAGWALPEDGFDQRDAVITKAEVRAIALARLAPGPGRLIWDVGAGTGAVGIECARFGAAVIAVERDPRRSERVRANAVRHGACLRLVTGEVPGALATLPYADAVFVGGGGPAVVDAVAARQPGRIVVTLAAVERVGSVSASLTTAGYAVDGALIHAARLVPLPGGVQRLAPINPVFVLWGSRGTPSRAAAGREGPP
ncbi:MAG: precorrin-6y C5,15-methyltransferase (decarboxylating) subunit CbiE [Streptosporangiaceae bacterium]